MIVKQSIQQIRFSTSADSRNNLDKAVLLSDDKSVQIYISFDLHTDPHLIFLPKTALLLDVLYNILSQKAIASSNFFAAIGVFMR